MNFKPTINRNSSVLVATVIIMVLLIAFYFFFYVPNNERKITEQHFRTMQRIDNNVHDKISNSLSLMNNLLEARINKSIDSEEIKKYVKQFKSEMFMLSDIEVFDVPQIKSTKPMAASKLSDSIPDFNGRILVDNSSRSFKLIAVKDSDGKRYRMSLQYNFEQFIKPLLRDKVFDEYVILSGGNCVFETFASGLSYQKRDSLFNVKNGIFAATIKDLTIGGNEYKAFLQPVGFDEKNEWIICGLLNQNSFQKQAKQLPGDIVLILVMLSLITIIVFPWIKLFFMGNSERLKLSDGFMSIIVAMLLTSMIFFMLFKYNTNARPDLGPESKQSLATSIEKNFYSEISAAYNQLCLFDTLQNKDSTFLNCNLININGKKEDIANGTNFIKDKHITPLSPNLADSIFRKNKFHQLFQAFWLDQKGAELFRWSGTNDIPPPYNWKSRNYFKKINSKDFYFLNKDFKKPYYLEQLISHAAGSFRTVLSKPSVDKNKIAALSFEVNSVKNAILPAGYTFVIINGAGDVVYHSDASRNLNENFVDECSENEKLKAAINSHSQVSFMTGYFEKKYSVYFKPVNNLPYFIAVLSDLDYRETRDIEIFGFTLTMLISFFIFLCVELGLILLVSGKKSKLKNQQVVTDWIWPRKSSHNAYIYTTLFNLATMLLLLFYFNTCSFLEYLFILLYTTTHITLTINLLYYVGYQTQRETKFKFFKLKAIIVSFPMLLIIIAAMAVYLKSDSIHFLSYVLCLTVLSIITISAFKNYVLKIGSRKSEENSTPSRFEKLASKLNYAQSFTAMAVTRLIITSGIPVVLFYTASYNFEQNLNMRYKQVDFANKLSAKFHDPKQNAIQAKMEFEKFSPIYIDSSWINSVVLIYEPFNNTSKSLKGMTEEYLLSHLRFYKNDLSFNNHDFYEKISSDSSIRFNDMTNEACMKDNTSVTQYELPQSEKQQFLQLSGVSFNYFFPRIYTLMGFQFWVILLFLMFALAFVIYRVIKKIFAIDLPDLNEFKQFDEEIFFDPGLNKLLFVIGLPGSGKNQLVRSLFDYQGRELNEELKDKKVMMTAANSKLIFDFKFPETNNVFISDLFKIADSSNSQLEIYKWNKEVAEIMNSKYECIVLNHFEYNIKDVKANRVKLNLLENLMIEGTKKLIILSSLHPVAFLESLYQNNQLTDEERKMLDEDRERWNILMGHFTNIYLPVKNYAPAQITEEKKLRAEYFGFWESIVMDISSYFKDKTIESKIKQAKKEIAYETQYTHQAQKLKKIMNEIAERKLINNDVFDNDDVVLKVQTSMQHVYSYIWDSLTSEEKFILRDLAEDGLVNSYDSMNLCMLINKGIIIKEDSPMRIFNKSFRNYILTSISRAESSEIEKRINDNGSWSTYKTPLLVVIFGVLAFLLSSQQETYNQVIGYVGTLAAGLPIIIKLLGFFEGPTSKASS